MINIPKDVEIEGSLDRGWDFEKKGYEERNVGNLLKIFRTEVVEPINEVPTSKWKAMSSAAQSLTGMAEAGTLGLIASGLGDVRSQLQNQATGVMNTLFAPIMNGIGLVMSKISEGIRGWFRAWEEAGEEFRRKQATKGWAGTRFMTDEERREQLAQYQVGNTTEYQEEVQLLHEVGIPTKIMDYKDTLY